MRMANEDRRRQLPWVVLGLSVTLTSAIVFAVWGSSLSNRTAVAVASRDIPAGAEVALDDFRAVEIASGSGADFVPMSDLESVMGRTVRSAMPEGSALHPDFVSTSSPLDPNRAVVGLVLQPGEYPSAHLGPGQSVGVVLTDDTRQSSAWDNRPGKQAAALREDAASLAQATVAEVSQVLESGQEALFVSLLASVDDAALISKAAASGAVRLILLPQEPPSPSDPSGDESTAPEWSR